MMALSGRKGLMNSSKKMEKTEFEILSSDLRRVAPQIPLKWGHIQNNRYDSELKRYCNIFDVRTLDELESCISLFDADHKNYYRRRWYLLRCADCDEYLFYKNPGVEHNPERLDKEWDIRINGKFLFDVKGTVIPRTFVDNYDAVIEDPSEIIKFYYDRQSRGVRYDMQNRLFVVHHSLVSPERELILRCAWGTKNFVYSKFVKIIKDIQFCTYKGCTASVIFLVETRRNQVDYKIAGLDQDLQQIINN